MSAAPTRDTPYFIVMNAASGSGDAREQHSLIETTLRDAGQKFSVLAVTDPSQLPSIAQRAVVQARQHGGAIVVAGGDGTINAVVQAVLPTGLPFGIVPQGTFNYSGRAHDIPLETAAAARALVHPRLKPIQVGLLNDRAFLVNASLGLYPQLLQDREAYKKEYGRNRLVAFWAAAMTLLREHRELELSIEHDQQMERIRTPTLFVGNNSLQLEQVGLPEAESVEQRRLAAVIVRPIGTAALFGLALRGALGQLGDAHNVRNFAFRRMSVRLPAGRGATVKVATDGEIWSAALPLQFCVAPHSLQLMSPQGKD